MDLPQFDCLIIKIGSSMLLEVDGCIRKDWLASIAQDIKFLHDRGKKVILVCSGSVALGRSYVQTKSSLSLAEKQAAASVGQIQLAHAYQTALAERSIVAAQLLLSLDDSEDRRRYLNTSNTLSTLLAHGIVPIINENDTVSTMELRIGDNDRLAARIAQMASADILLFLSDIDGLYSADPYQDSSARHIARVEQIDTSIMALAQDSHSKTGTGGMTTKIIAAQIAVDSGCHLVISQGYQNHPIQRWLDNERCTWFIAKHSPRSARKHWLAHQLQPKGQIKVDHGAEQALAKGKSLLSVGITGITGKFSKGDAVTMTNATNQKVAVGLTNYSDAELIQILGRHSTEIERILGYSHGDTIIHGDNLVFGWTL